MKIAVIGTIWINTPPPKYGGTEEVVFNLVNGLTDKGHDVTFIGPRTAKVNARVIPTIDKPLIDMGVPWDDGLDYTLDHLKKAFSYASEFDVLHFQLNTRHDYLGLPLVYESPKPVLTTIHFEGKALAKKYPERFAKILQYKDLPYVSISNSQREHLPIHFIQTVYNSINLTHFPFVEKPDDYLVWIGKIKPDKGTKEAIEVALNAQKKLTIIGAVDTDIPSYMDYFKQDVEPYFDGDQITWVGEKDVQEKAEILGHAKAFINPVQWHEPFGLVMLEAQATGTPVIALRRGSTQEVIKDGVTGYVVDTLDEMIEKVGQVDQLDRNACRRFVEEEFTIERMVDGYIEAYQKAIQEWPRIHKE